MAGTVRLEREGPVARVVLDHAARRNAMTLEMWQSLRVLFGALTKDSDLRAVVIRGAPEGGAFSAGADRTEFPRNRGTRESALEYGKVVRAALEAVDACPVPVLALIDGPCVGGGLEIALFTDLRLATARSTFGLPAVRLSHSPDLVDIRRLVALVGPAAASAILLAATSISAERAWTLGLLTWMGPAEQLEAAAQEYLDGVLAAAPRAVRAAKQGLRAVLDSRPGAAEAYDALVPGLYAGADFLEATHAFIERRPATFTGA